MIRAIYTCFLPINSYDGNYFFFTTTKLLDRTLDGTLKIFSSNLFTFSVAGGASMMLLGFSSSSGGLAASAAAVLRNYETEGFGGKLFHRTCPGFCPSLLYTVKFSPRKFPKFENWILWWQRSYWNHKQLDHLKCFGWCSFYIDT